MKKIVLFDFDGVISDSFEAALKTAKHLLPEITAEKYKKWFEGNVYESVEKELKNIVIDEFNKKWFENYGPKVINQKIVPGIKNEIISLSKKYTLTIISSNTSELIQKYLKYHIISRYFETILGADHHLEKKLKIKMILSRYNTNPIDCVLVTDTLGDLIEAQMIGIKSIAVTWGFHDYATLAKANPCGFVENTNELSKKINSIF